MQRGPRPIVKTLKRNLARLHIFLFDTPTNSTSSFGLRDSYQCVISRMEGHNKGKHPIVPIQQQQLHLERGLLPCRNVQHRHFKSSLLASFDRSLSLYMCTESESYPDCKLYGRGRRTSWNRTEKLSVVVGSLSLSLSLRFLSSGYMSTEMLVVLVDHSVSSHFKNAVCTQLLS